MGVFALLIFSSTNFTMQAEAAIKGEGIATQIIPTPREITLSCGLAIKVHYDAVDKIRELIEAEKIQVKEIYRLEGQGKDKILEKI